jgi:putative glutamine amidotransferase
MRGLLIPDIGPVALPGGDADGYASRLERALPGHEFAVRGAEMVEIIIPDGAKVVAVQLGMWWDMTASHERKRNTREVARLLAEAGAFPLLVPPVLGTGMEEILSLADHLLMPGGDDIHPDLYGEPVTHSVGLSHERDKWDIAMVRAARAGRIGITGICRGAQIVNVALGGTLIQDINLDGRTQESHAATQHDVLVTKDSRAEALLDRAVRDMPSRHHQEIGLLAAGLEVTGRSPDGLVEIMEGDGVMCYQFHPENMPESRQSRVIFEEMSR